MTIPILTACAGFLLAVLWLDLIFDSQIRGRTGDHLQGDPHDEAALSSIAGYYRRASTRPMSGLIAVVMAMLLVTLAIQAVRGAAPGWLMILCAVLAGGPIMLALLRTVPNAVRLGRRTDPIARQIQLARSIYRDHLICAAFIASFLVVLLVPAH